ncbi:MAG TPA: hypothetical protein VLE99_02350 [Candidatus Saccharimonadales bacterium]|nr:hypothetical protein [Candidatus Saccharimonadales bacterium]
MAGNIVEQHGEGVAPRGLYFEGTAVSLDGLTQDSPEYKLFAERFNKGPEILSDPHSFYKVTVTDWYVFDARDSTPGQKYHLER